MHLDPRRTALCLVDIQGGTLAMPLAPHDPPHIVAACRRLGEAFAAAGAAIAVVRIAFSPDGGDRLTQPVDRPMMLPPGPLPAGWADLAPPIALLPAAIAITKRHWSAFHGTELDLQLRRRRIETLVVAGIATNFGVESTARDAWQLGYAVVVAADACTTLGAGMHDFALGTTLPRVSRVRATAAIVAALAPQTAPSERATTTISRP